MGRELVANALIHQDFTLTGTGPMIEIFPQRIEMTNPGVPLIDSERFLDLPPRSRNEITASFLRRVGICEERGSGIDKVVFQTELHQLPASLFEKLETHTRAILFAYREFKTMETAERSDIFTIGANSFAHLFVFSAPVTPIHNPSGSRHRVLRISPGVAGCAFAWYRLSHKA